MNHPKRNIICGTPGFIAPEILKSEDYNEKSDVFSIGCLLYYLLTRTLLFCGGNFEDVINKNRDCNLDYILSN